MQSDRAALRQRFTCDVRNDNRRRSFPRISHIPMYSRGGGVRFSKLRKSNGLATNHGHSFAHNTQKHSFADFVRMVGRSSIMRQKIDPTRLSNFLFQIAAVIYAISLFTRSALTHLAFAPSLKGFQQTTSGDTPVHYQRASRTHATAGCIHLHHCGHCHAFTTQIQRNSTEGAKPATRLTGKPEDTVKG